MTQKFTVGDTVRMLARVTVPGSAPIDNPYPRTIGKTATVVEASDNLGSDETQTLAVKWDEPTGDHGRNWGSVWFEKVEAPGRPLVHFSDEKAGRDRSKARAYAGRAVSRILEDRDNEVLRAAADGESVDAYDLNRAVLAAMRSASTRLGQSSGRRVMATEFAHLGHIVQAVLENHADNLPGYAPGERSRALAELKAEVASSLAEAKREIEHAGTVNQRLTQDLGEERQRNLNLREERATLTQAASDERRRLCGEIDALKANVAEAERARVIADNALEYAKQFLSDADRARVEGFADGVATEYDYRQDA